MRVSLLILALLVAAYPQTRRQPQHRTPPQTPAMSAAKPLPVTVKLQSGKVVVGKFMSANDRSLTIITEEGSREIQLSTVVEIRFDSTDEPSLGSESARAAIKALRRLDSAVSVGITYREYGTRLIDAKVSLDEAMEGMPEGEVRLQLTLAMNDYQIASGVWEEKIQGRSFLDPDSSYYQTLLKTYPGLLTTGTTDNSGRQLHVSVDEILNVIWESARVRIDKASRSIQ